MKLNVTFKECLVVHTSLGVKKQKMYTAHRPHLMKNFDSKMYMLTGNSKKKKTFNLNTYRCMYTTMPHII